MFDVVTLGEIMTRLSPPLNERLSYCNEFKRQIGGAELNVASALSNMGTRTAIITKIPDNPLGVFAKNCLRSYGVSDDLLVYDKPDARLGIYYTESGAYPRKPSVVYDRKNSSFCSLKLEDIDADAFKSSKIFHTTGISLALGEEIRENIIEIIKKFKESGVKISFDVNFRANLWNEDLARETITRILPYVDIFFCSRETAEKTFGRTSPIIEEVLKSFSTDFDIQIVASTERQAHSPKVHSFTSYIYDAKTDRMYTEEPYNNIDVIDRIGSGDAYIAGVLYGLLNNNYDCAKALQYGNAFSVLKNTIPGDALHSSIAEINSIIAAHNGNGPVSEMNR